MNNLSELIKLSGIKQETVAREVGVSQATISFWKSGKKTPSLENAIALANVFDVSVGCIAGTEAIPEGYPDCYVIPASYTEVVKKHPSEPKAAEPESSFIDEPFSAEQLAYLNKRLEEFAKQIRNDNKKGE